MRMFIQNTGYTVTGVVTMNVQDAGIATIIRHGFLLSKILALNAIVLESLMVGKR
jgi:hypothetical protein